LRLDRIQPWEGVAVEELDRRKRRVVVHHGHRVEAALAPQHDVDGIPEALEVLPLVFAVKGLEGGVEERAHLALVLLAVLERVLDPRAQVRVQAVERGRYRRHGTVSLGRLMALALALEEVRAKEERQEVERIAHERLADRV